MTQSPTVDPVAALAANTDRHCCEMPSRVRTGTTTIKPKSGEPGQVFHSGGKQLNAEACPSTGRTNAAILPQRCGSRGGHGVWGGGHTVLLVPSTLSPSVQNTH